jgi:hypothetical protein
MVMLLATFKRLCATTIGRHVKVTFGSIGLRVCIDASCLRIIRILQVVIIEKLTVEKSATSKKMSSVCLLAGDASSVWVF